LSFGIGIHYGEALLGLVGTERRLDYTAVGDSVNTAERLEEAAGAGQILISSAVADRVRDQVDVRSLPAILLPGKRQPVDVYELVGLRGA
jgi:class 3 adenylate cyclase